MKLSDAYGLLELAVETAGSPDAARGELKVAIEATFAVEAFAASVRAGLVRSAGRTADRVS